MAGNSCPETIWEGFSSYPCGRPVKRNGYCGIHARMHEKREEERNEWKKKHQKRKQNETINKELVAKLEQEFGIAIARSTTNLEGEEPRLSMGLSEFGEILRKVSGKVAS